MLVRIEPLKSFIAARSLVSSIGATTILTRREGFGIIHPRYTPDPSGGSRVQYFLGEMPCPVVFLQQREAQAAARYRSIIKDLEFVELALAHALALDQQDTPSYQVSPTDAHIHRPIGHPNTLVIRAIYTAAVVSYAKAFAEAHGRGLKLEVKAVLTTAGQRQIHERIMEDRHSYVAHAGHNDREASNTVVVLAPDGQPRILDGPFAHATFLQSPPEEDLRDFADVVRVVRLHCEMKERVNMAAVCAQVEAMTIEQLYRAAIANGDRMVPKRR